MASSAFPTIVAALYATAQSALPGVFVVRGRDFSMNPDDVVMIGVTALDDSPGWDSAGSFDQEFQTFAGARVETGAVHCVAYARNGASDQGAATAAAFALVDGLGAAIRADKTLGVTALDYVVAQTVTGGVREQQNNEGAVTELSFAVKYEARI